MPSVAILGASGYAGGELIRILDAHPSFEVAHLGAHTTAGSSLGAVHPHLGGGDRVLGSLDPDGVPEVDVAFLALPHGASAEPAMALLERGIRVVDLGSDFRLDSPERYLGAYGTDHPYPDQLGRWTYGLPELFGGELAGVDRVAAPGCYPTSVSLGLGPLVRSGLLGTDDIIVDAMSGVSGAGRGTAPGLQFGAVAESVKAYKVLEHRHQPEMERVLEALDGAAHRVTFTPHLVPMQRGILATIHAPVQADVSQADLEAAFDTAYANAPFVERIDQPPETRWVAGSNNARIAVRLDERSGRALVLSAIDNLVKGAAGQAVQCANLMSGYDETAGLPTTGAMP